MLAVVQGIVLLPWPGHAPLSYEAQHVPCRATPCRGPQVYSVADSPLCLTGTAEVPLGGVYMDRILDEAQLPIKMAAYGHCFRTEAGAAGEKGGAGGGGLV